MQYLEECLPSLQVTGMESKRWICGYPWEGMLNSRDDSKIFRRISIFNIHQKDWCIVYIYMYIYVYVKRLGLLDFILVSLVLSSFCLLLLLQHTISMINTSPGKKVNLTLWQDTYEVHHASPEEGIHLRVHQPLLICPKRKGPGPLVVPKKGIHHLGVV